LKLVLKLEAPMAPFCGSQMTLNLFGQKMKVVFHPMIIGASYPIEKSYGRSPSFYKNKFCTKKTNDHVVYFLNFVFV
jgi:hypothetical protein